MLCGLWGKRFCDGGVRPRRHRERPAGPGHRGRELPGTHPALVLTTKEFNKLSDVLVTTITQGGDFARHAGFAVALAGTGSKTQGVALVSKIRMLLDRSRRK